MKGILLLVALGLYLGSSAQEVYTSSGRPESEIKKQKPKKKKGFDASRIIAGGGLGLSFGNVTAVSVAPIVGYKISDRFAAGVGLGFQYVHIKDFWEIQDYNTGLVIRKPYESLVYSGSVWGRYIFWRNLFAHVEYEHNFMSITTYHLYTNSSTGQSVIDKEKLRYNAPSLLVGAGLRQPVSERLSFVLTALYDVIQDQYSPYRNRIDFRVGVNVGF